MNEFYEGSDDAQHHADETGHEFDASAPVPVELVGGPVRIESHGPRSISSGQIPVGTNPTQVAGELRQRHSVLLVARGGDVYLGGSQVTTGSGFLLPQDASIELDATCDVYAVAAAAGVATVHFLAQHTDG